VHKILVLWATPRSTGTAFEWMMRQRGDMTCFHEPFGEWWYEGDGALWPRLTPDSPRKPGLNFEKVWSILKQAAIKGPVFSKDFAHYIENYWTDAFLDYFNHSFLVRDAAKVVTSVQKRWPDVHLKELGYLEQRRLFDRLADQRGKAPPLIDSDDLLDNPTGIVKAYCEAVGIPFIEKALTWKPGANVQQYSWYDGGSWHGKLKGSTGLMRQKPGHTDISVASDRAKELYDLVLPHYQHLYTHRLKNIDSSERQQ